MRSFKDLLRFFLAGLLLVTGLGKLLDVPGFIQVILSYDVFPPSVAMVVSVFMVLLELKLAELLILNPYPLKTAFVALIMHIGFTLWAVVALLRGLDIPNCGCFGVFWARPLTWGTVGEDLFMVIVCAALIFCSQKLTRGST